MKHLRKQFNVKKSKKKVILTWFVEYVGEDVRRGPPVAVERGRDAQVDDDVGHVRGPLGAVGDVIDAGGGRE
jgi:hypothetical protein